MYFICLVCIFMVFHLFLFPLAFFSCFSSFRGVQMHLLACFPLAVYQALLFFHGIFSFSYYDLMPIFWLLALFFYPSSHRLAYDSKSGKLTEQMRVLLQIQSSSCELVEASLFKYKQFLGV